MGLEIFVREKIWAFKLEGLLGATAGLQSCYHCRAAAPTPRARIPPKT
jgi:hypothetical protein